MIAALLVGLVASFGVLSASPSRAQEVTAPTADRAPWTLERVLEAARQESPAVQAAMAQGRAGAAAGRTRYTRSHPSDCRATPTTVPIGRPRG